MLGEIKADPEKVRVNGPKSIIERIDKVVAEVDVTGLASDTVLQSKLVFYDADGKAIDNTLLTLQDLKDENDVRVQVEVRNTRRLQLDLIHRILRQRTVTCLPELRQSQKRFRYQEAQMYLRILTKSRFRQVH